MHHSTGSFCTVSFDRISYIIFIVNALPNKDSVQPFNQVGLEKIP